GMDRQAVLRALHELTPATIGIYLLTMVVTHLFRTLRWEYLLRALGTSLPFKRLLPISSVGFMAILALPVRLGEFVRPYLVARARSRPVRRSARSSPDSGLWPTAETSPSSSSSRSSTGARQEGGCGSWRAT